MTEKNNQGPDETSAKQRLPALSLIGSLFAGAFGVQTQKNRDRDFKQGKFHHFIIGGILFSILFILAIIGIVKLVMSTAGA
jgi:hypothetical protein